MHSNGTKYQVSDSNRGGLIHGRRFGKSSERPVRMELAKLQRCSNLRPGPTAFGTCSKTVKEDHKVDVAFMAGIRLDHHVKIHVNTNLHVP